MPSDPHPLADAIRAGLTAEQHDDGSTDIVNVVDALLAIDRVANAMPLS